MATSQRPAPPPPQQQSLPSIASITSDLPPPEPSPHALRHSTGDPRDSGNWSISQSKHSSGVSNNTGIQLHSILNADDSPSRGQMPDTPHSARIASQQPLPSLNQGFDQRASLDATSLLDSRRSSVDSRMNTGMGHLQISPSSPYDSQNVSRVSLVSNLQQQRGITTTNNEQRNSNGASPLSPASQRNGLRPQAAPRRAPVINPNPRSVSGMPDPTAAAPTKGYPWAFPDQEPEDQRRSSSAESSAEHSVPSRQNSFAASVNSSVFTTDSAMLPTGQKRFSEDMPQTHHHSMQHRSVSSLQPNDPNASGAATGNYSRTPELRVSHKMAERKRRSEMKNLFDELNSILPSSAGGKSSKWEILTKSIEHINNLKRDVQRSTQIHRENDQFRSQLDGARRVADENRLLHEEVNVMWQNLRRLDPNSPHVYGTCTSQLAQDQAQGSNNHASTLPPIQQNHWNQNQPSHVMQGVEYAGSQPYEHR